MEPNVQLYTRSLGELLLGKGDGSEKQALKIPDYQRIYCWEEKQVVRLLDDIKNHGHKEYHQPK